MPKVLILGGTTESAALAKYLAEDEGFVPITSLAGRTRNPAIVSGAMRRGGFGGIVQHFSLQATLPEVRPSILDPGPVAYGEHSNSVEVPPAFILLACRCSFTA